MASFLRAHLDQLKTQIDHLGAPERLGRVSQVTGLIVESEGPRVAIGDVCDLRSSAHVRLGSAEVVGFRGNRNLLIPLEPLVGLQPGCWVVAKDGLMPIPKASASIGRILNGLGQAIDDKGPLVNGCAESLEKMAPNPLTRQRITQRMETGIKAIDTFIPIGYGQRLGIFAGSGVGKSTLLGMLARASKADVNVIALVGERGRELRDFIEIDLQTQGLEKSIIVVSTSDQPAPVRIRAALLATALAEQLRDDGKNVLLMMDSLTRLAMAQREVGLSVGEPPASRGYTPSVFSLLPKILERTGMGPVGSITALYTVLVEGDDMNEPIADAVRGILDGHMVLTRDLAARNHYPSIDILQSLSRLQSVLQTADEQQLVGAARQLLAVYRQHEDLIQVGAYVPKTNPKVDQAIACQDALMGFLKQDRDAYVPQGESYPALQKALQ
jgi:flagellum-specific ATP synthase